ncbi:MAG: Rrf2 family transcriptional regulator [Ignavibacteria bacterium]|jgi:Rrf2 family iron-sulfur cluster assembly transcriptional regulator
MFKIPKAVEYSILALKYIDENSEQDCISAKEISSNVDIPFDLLAKILQKLNKFSIIKSVQGTRGGYVLNNKLDSISLNYLVLILGYNIQVTDCMLDKPSTDDCKRVNDCCLRSPLYNLQKKIIDLFENTTIKEVLTQNGQ